MTENYYRYLQEVQYKDPSNLDARASLHQRFSRNRQGLHRWMMPCNPVEAFHYWIGARRQ